MSVTLRIVLEPIETQIGSAGRMCQLVMTSRVDGRRDTTLRRSPATAAVGLRQRLGPAATASGTTEQTNPKIASGQSNIFAGTENDPSSCCIVGSPTLLSCSYSVTIQPRAHRSPMPSRTFQTNSHATYAS